MNILNIFITLTPPPASSEALPSCMEVEAIVEEAEEKDEEEQGLLNAAKVAAAARKEAGGEERAKVEGRGNARGSAF